MTNFNFISVFRLWAEVFHVSASGAGTVKWQQVSEDLVPVNITCIQDTPECVFHITAYNSQVDKILDVRLVQPGLILWYSIVFFFFCKYNSIRLILLCRCVFLCYRHANRSSIRMLCLLERSDDKWHVGIELHVANRRKTVPRMLCKWTTKCQSTGHSYDITHYFCLHSIRFLFIFFLFF